MSLAKPVRRAVSALILATGLLALLLAAPTAQAATPAVTTGEAAEVHFNRVVLNGEVNPSGTELENCVFEYGETESYGHTAACSKSPSEIGSGTSPVAVEAAPSGLEANAHYHFRLTAKGQGTTVNGSDGTFTTLGAPQLAVRVLPVAESVIWPEHRFPGPGETSAATRPAAKSASRTRFPPASPPRISTSATSASPASTPSPEAASTTTAMATAPISAPTAPPAPAPPNASSPPSSASTAMNTASTAKTQACSRAKNCCSPPRPKFQRGWKEPSKTAPKQKAAARPRPAAVALFWRRANRNSASSASTPRPPTPPANPIRRPAATPTSSPPNSISRPPPCANSVTEENYWVFFNKCPLYDPKDITADLPPGLIANPQGVPHCTLAEYFGQECNRLKAAVGTAGLRLYAMGSSVGEVHRAGLSTWNPPVNIRAGFGGGAPLSPPPPRNSPPVQLWRPPNARRNPVPPQQAPFCPWGVPPIPFMMRRGEFLGGASVPPPPP